MKRSIFTLLIWLWAVSAFSQQTIDPRILPPGTPRNVQVDGVNVPRTNSLTDPFLNFRDTSEILITNPSSGNLDFTINAGAITDAKLAAGAITTRTKLPVAIVYDDETNTFTAAQIIGGAGSFSINGSTSGSITFGRAAAAGTYNFNLPTSAGTSGLPLLSGGGGVTPMSFSILGLAGGGTNQNTWTAGRCVQVNAAGTGLESAPAACGTGGAGNITLIQGTTNEIGVAGGTGPTATLSLPTTLDLSAKILQGASPLKFEGATTNAFTTAITITDPTANRTFTIPNANSVAVQPQTAGANSFITGIDSAGVITTAQLDSDLIALGANTGTGIWVPTGAGTGIVRTITCVANETLCTNGSGVAGNPTIGIHGDVVSVGRAATFGAFTYNYGSSILGIPLSAGDPAATSGLFKINSTSNLLKVVVNSVVRSVLLNGTDCPTGPVTYTASTNALGCGTYPAAVVSGTTGSITKFTSASAVGDSGFMDEDGTGVLITGATRFGATGTNDLSVSYAAITGNKTRNALNVDGNEVVSTGTLPDGNAIKIQHTAGVPRFVDGGPRYRLAQFIIGGDSVGSPVLVDGDDQPSVFYNHYGQGITINSVWCQSDAGSSGIQLQKDDGSPTNMLSASLSCSTGTGATTTTFVSGENLIASTNRVNFVMVTAGGVAKRVTISIRYTLD